MCPGPDVQNRPIRRATRGKRREFGLIWHVWSWLVYPDVKPGLTCPMAMPQAPGYPMADPPCSIMFIRCIISARRSTGSVPKCSVASWYP